MKCCDLCIRRSIVYKCNSVILVKESREGGRGQHALWLCVCRLGTAREDGGEKTYTAAARSEMNKMQLLHMKIQKGKGHSYAMIGIASCHNKEK